MSHEQQAKVEREPARGERGASFWHRGAGVVAWGVVLMWLGVTAFLAQISLLPPNHWFAYFLAGFGAIIMVRWLMSYSMKSRFELGSTIAGAFIFAIGIAYIYGLSESIFWPFIVIAIGGVLIIYTFWATGTKVKTMSRLPAADRERQHMLERKGTVPDFRRMIMV